MKKLCLAAGLLVATRPVFADLAQDLNNIDNTRERRQILEQKETALKHQHRNLEILNTFYSRAKYFRDYRIGGPEGVSKQAETWANSVQSWINQWSLLTETLHNINGTNIETSARNIENIIDDFYKTFNQHQTAASQIQKQLVDNQRDLEAMGPLASEIAKGYEPFVNGLNSHRNHLIEMNSLLLQNFQKERIELLGNSILVFRNTILSKVRELLSKYPDLETILDQTQQMLDMMDQQGAKLVELEQAAVATRAALTAGTYFAAESNFNRAKDLENSLRSALSPARYGARNVNFYLGRIQTSMSATQTQWNSLLGLQTKYTIFYRFFTTQRRSLSADCRNPALIPKRNCELLRTLNHIQIDLPKVKVMKDTELSLLEDKLIAVKENRG